MHKRVKKGNSGMIMSRYAIQIPMAYWKIDVRFIFCYWIKLDITT